MVNWVIIKLPNKLEFHFCPVEIGLHKVLYQTLHSYMFQYSGMAWSTIFLSDFSLSIRYLYLVIVWKKNSANEFTIAIYTWCKINVECWNVSPNYYMHLQKNNFIRQRNFFLGTLLKIVICSSLWCLTTWGAWIRAFIVNIIIIYI